MAAPKGNKYAEGNNGGRPPKYKSPKEMEKRIVSYFEWCQGEFEERDRVITTTKGEGKSKVTTTDVIPEIICIRQPEIPSITGIALYLGFSSKDSIYDYSKKKEFSDCIKRGILTIENNYEQGLWIDRPTGVIFALKNMGWVDKKEIETTERHLTVEERDAKIKELLLKAEK